MILHTHRQLFGSRGARSTCLLLAVWFAFSTGPLSASAEELERTDQAISDQVEDELLYDPGIVSTRIDASTDSGVVTLTGKVNSLLAKDRATRVAQAVSGVRSVVNRLEVTPTPFRADTQIRDDVYAALRDDPAIDADEVGVRVENSEVTIFGQVDSYQERMLVASVVKGVRGVTAIDDRIEVDFVTHRSEKEIRADVEDRLTWSTRLDDDLIDVAVDGQRVSLKGQVSSATEKTLATAQAWVAGVSSVDNSQLAVAPPTGQDSAAQDSAAQGTAAVRKPENRSDDELKKAIRDALLFDPRVNSLNVTVEVAAGNVTLRGNVADLQATRAAEQDARNTAGVTRVINRLKVRPEIKLLDTEIAERVREALMRNPFVERFEISVTVIGGNVHLYGTVDSRFEKRQTEEVAARINGVIDVENHLLVDTDKSYVDDPYVDDTYIDSDDLLEPNNSRTLRTDLEIKQAIERELWWSPFVDANEVRVSVDHGSATLTGAVDSQSQRDAATENAYEGGADFVDNDLEIY